MADRNKPDVVRPTDDIYGWVEHESSIMFKAVTGQGDPVELTAAESREVANALIEWAVRLESFG